MSRSYSSDSETSDEEGEIERTKQHIQEAKQNASHKRRKTTTTTSSTPSITSSTSTTTTTSSSTSRPTLSIAIPGSVVANAQSAELRTYLAGQIARAACIFNADEVIIYRDDEWANSTSTTSLAGEFRGSHNRTQDPHLFLARILQYLETPQYLRKALYPVHNDLQFAGLLNPLDCPHHVRADKYCQYREGVIVARPHPTGSYANVGLLQDVQLNRPLPVGTRVTVKMSDDHTQTKKKVIGEAVSPNEPSKVTGLYWGYSVRIASTFSSIFSECPYAGGYDMKIGTSDKGENIGDIVTFGSPSHTLVVFGGLHGIEAAVENDQSIAAHNASELFDHWINTCPDQGSRTIRTEEAILISLAAIKQVMHEKK